MTSSAEHEYLLGTDSAELVRLGFQHRVWAEQAYALWRRAGFGPGQTLLDVGCGPGYGAFDLAELVGPEGRVIAVDESERFVEHVKSQARARGVGHIDVRRCDVQRLDLPESSIDGAFARWVLCYLKEPEAVVRQVAYALKPGGALAVQDYFNYLAITLVPKSPAFERVVKTVVESWRSSGGDIDLAGRLPEIMSGVGLNVTEIRPIVRVARPGSALWEWPASFFRMFVPVLVDQGLLTQHEAGAFHEEWAMRSKDPSAFFCTPPMLDIIGVKT